MSFKEQLVATLIGTFAGFCGSLVLFWIREALQGRNKKKSLIKNLLYELDYNINLFSKYEAELTQCIEDVNSDSKSVYCSIEYTKVARFFSIQFYQAGLISEYLHPEDMKRWNDFLSSLSVGSEEYVKDMLDKWRNSKVEKEEVFKRMKHERGQIKYAREMSEYLKEKVKL